MVSIHGPLGYEPNTLTTAPLRFHALMSLRWLGRSVLLGLVVLRHRRLHRGRRGAMARDPAMAVQLRARSMPYDLQVMCSLGALVFAHYYQHLWSSGYDVSLTR